jgi:hypothetical protein
VVVNFTCGENQSILEKAIDPIQITDKIDRTVDCTSKNTCTVKPVLRGHF